MCVYNLCCLVFWQRRTGIKNDDIDDFLAKANAVDEAIRGMRDGKVNPDDIKIDGLDCDTEEQKAEKEVFLTWKLLNTLLVLICLLFLC